MQIQLEAEFNEQLGRTVFYDKKTGTILFTATEECAELCDPIELAIAIALQIDEPIELIIREGVR